MEVVYEHTGVEILVSSKGSIRGIGIKQSTVISHAIPTNWKECLAAIDTKSRRYQPGLATKPFQGGGSVTKQGISSLPGTCFLL